MRDAVQPYVYFVRRADGEGPVKIGCSRTPALRLQSLMCWAPYRLALVATIPGDSVVERRFHALFRDQHSHSEWFEPTPELVAVMNAVAAGAFDVETLPAPRMLKQINPRPQWVKDRVHAERGIERLAKAGVAVPARFVGVKWWLMPRDEQPVLVAEMVAFVAQFPRSMTCAPSLLKRYPRALKAAA